MTPAMRLAIEVLRRELSPPFTEYDLIPLPRGEVVTLRRRCPLATQRVLELVRRGLLAETAITRRPTRHERTTG